MTSLFNFTKRNPSSNGYPYAQDINNIENTVNQMFGIVTQNNTAITGITTLNVGAFLAASGAIASGITIQNRGLYFICPSGGIISGNVITLANGNNMAIANNGSTITFNSTGNSTDSTFPISDIITGNVTSSRHGFAPKSFADDYKFLNSAATPTYTSISGEVLTFNTSSTNNVSSSNHGFAPQTDGNQFKFLNSAAVPTYTAISGEVLTLYDSTINDFNTSNHGFAPKSEGGGKMLRDNGWVSVANLAWTISTADSTFLTGLGIIANKGTVLTYALPTLSATGQIIRITGMNAGLWKISQAANQQIHFGNLNTTVGTGGYLASTLTYDSVKLVCSVKNLEWIVISSIGNITVV